MDVYFFSNLAYRIIPCNVLDSIYTLRKNGFNTVTISDIARTLSGNLKLKATHKLLNIIRNSILKMQNIYIHINCEKEMYNRKDTRTKEIKYYAGKLLNIDEEIVKSPANGKKIIMIHLLADSPLYQYANQIHQIAVYPNEYLMTEKNNNVNSISIKRYVIIRIIQIISQNKLKNNRLSLYWQYGEKKGGLYNTLNYHPDGSEKWRTKTKPMIMKNIKATLDKMKKLGVIQEYVPYRASGDNSAKSAVLGFEIVIPDRR